MVKTIAYIERQKKSILLNSDIETGKAQKSFSAGLNFYKIFWTFIVFSILGFVFESMACFIQYGAFYKRQGLLYGPISQIYGLGAVVLILFSRKLYNKSIIFLFIFCSLMGGIFEYLCSLIEEVVFGCVSWQYYYMTFNFQGRTNLLFSLVWGVLGVVMLIYLFPLFSRLLESIPNKQGIIITWVVIVFLSFDIFISASAVKRESERHRNIPPSNAFQIFLDKKYPDSYMKEIYPSLRFK